MTKNINSCPKAKRCKHSDKCINFDTFKGEYLCFESKPMYQYDRYKPKNKRGDKREM